jgi:hypothetical protein
MIHIMPLWNLGDPLPYMAGSYHKATPFVIENNVSPIEYMINIVRQQTKSHRTKMVLYMVSVRVFFRICRAT